jgi:hypothetical protein
MGEPDFVVHYVVSLGCMCAPAKHLQRLQLRLCAGPFDWIFSTPQMVTHCLQDDFACFLRPGELFETNGVAGAGHDTYSTMIDRKVSERDQQSTAWQGRRSRKHLQSPQTPFRLSSTLIPFPQTIFNHHNPMLPADNEYFRRCVERFRALLRGGSGEGGAAAAAGSGRTLFVLCELENRCVAPPPCQSNIVRHATTARLHMYTSCVLQHMHLSSNAMPAPRPAKWSAPL